MSCYSCGSSFGLFKKEQGCKNCGYSFCKDCLSKKAEVPKLNNERHKVCLKCHKILTGQMQPNVNPGQYSPPEAYKKRVAKLENPENRPPEKKILNVDPQPKVSKQFQNMSKEDIAIAQRLEKLKENKDKKTTVPSQKEMEQRLQNLKKNPDAAPPPSEQEMAARLAKLKGQDPNNVNKPHVFVKDRRPQAQQVEDLLLEICDEVEIDSHGIDCAADVQNRLDAFKGNTDYDKHSDLQNNLNTPNSKDQFTYIKNIPQVDNKFESASGESVDWSDMNRLINQVAGELELDASKAIASLQKDNELWDRLHRLKKKQNNLSEDTEKESKERVPVVPGAASEVGGDDQEDDENEEEACKNIIKQLLEESRIEDELEEDELVGRKLKKVPNVHDKASSSKSSKTSMRDYPEPAYEPDPDELPWCCICNNDASMRCMGCDGDLYCKKCYKEGHDREDYADHPTRAYKAPVKK